MINHPISRAIAILVSSPDTEEADAVGEMRPENERLTRENESFRAELAAVDAALGYDPAWAEKTMLHESVAILKKQRDSLRGD